MLFFLIIVVVSATSFMVTKKHKTVVNSELPSYSPVSSPSPVLSPKPTANNNYNLNGQKLQNQLNKGLVQNNVPYSQFNKSANCNVGGDVNFFSQSSAQDSAKLDYTGIDNPNRQIIWHINPQDELKVGPNLAAQLELPDGSSMVTVTLPESPKSKKYILTASMTYGRQVGDNIKVDIANCSGSINVNLNY